MNDLVQPTSNGEKANADSGFWATSTGDILEQLDFDAFLQDGDSDRPFGVLGEAKKDPLDTSYTISEDFAEEN